MKTLLTALAASTLVLGSAAPASAAVNPLVELIFFPIVKLVEVQSALQPEKDSCWNEGRENVAGCALVDEVEAGRPTPF